MYKRKSVGPRMQVQHWVVGKDFLLQNQPNPSIAEEICNTATYLSWNSIRIEFGTYQNLSILWRLNKYIIWKLFKLQIRFLKKAYYNTERLNIYTLEAFTLEVNGSNHQRCSVQKGVLNFTGKHLYWSWKLSSLVKIIKIVETSAKLFPWPNWCQCSSLFQYLHIYFRLRHQIG